MRKKNLWEIEKRKRKRKREREERKERGRKKRKRKKKEKIRKKVFFKLKSQTVLPQRLLVYTQFEFQAII